MTSTATASTGRLASLRAQLTGAQWRRLWAMFGFIALLHIVGFGVFFFLVAPQHYRGLGLGVAITAYTLGLRHAFDADHISAIDNTTRKLMNAGQRPLSVGFFFSLGHSTIVVAIGAGIAIAEKAIYHAVSDENSTLERFGGVFGTVVSASFLYLIALMNIVILVGIVKMWRAMRNGEYDEEALEAQLEQRGLMYRFFGRWMNAIKRPWQMYPVGVVFGLGFDTATEVALLATAALLATQHIPWYAIMALPVLFTAGMTLMDTLDGCFMNIAYGWAFLRPARKVYYNLTITTLSVAVCLLVGTIEVLGLLPQQLHWSGPFWQFMIDFDLNRAGFAIVGLFVATWLVAIVIWKLRHLGEVGPGGPNAGPPHGLPLGDGLAPEPHQP